MFNGTENYDKDFFGPLEQAGATDMNGTTNEDRTNYFENVPTNALDLALWMESDRMGHLTGAISQPKLDEQRGVVQNEKRQGENEPYGKVWDFLTPKLYPGQPSLLLDYHRLHGGSGRRQAGRREGLVPDLLRRRQRRRGGGGRYRRQRRPKRRWRNISATSRPARRWRGSRPGSPKRTGSQRGIMQDRVPQARIYKVWNIPGWATADADYLNLASDVLSSGKSSRLYKRLVYDDQIATDVSASLDLREIGGLFVIEATARPGVELAPGGEGG